MRLSEVTRAPALESGAAEEVRPGHRLAVLGLHLEGEQEPSRRPWRWPRRSPALSSRARPGAGRRRCGVEARRAPDQEAPRRRQHGGARPRVAAADAVDEVARRLRGRSQPSSFLSRGARVACVASCGMRGSVSSSLERAQQEPRAPIAARRADSSPAVSSGPIGVGLAQQHGARVHARVHLERRDAGLGLAADDRPRDRRGAAVARQQRGVDVDRAARRHVEHGLGQDLAERRDHRDVGGEARRGARATRDRAAAAAGARARPASRARRFTGEAVRGWPRPAGRSGWVTRPRRGDGRGGRRGSAGRRPGCRRTGRAAPTG